MPATLQGAAAEFLRERFGGEITSDDDTIQVGTSAVEITGNDPEAVQLTIVNLSSNTVYVSLDNRVSSSRGIRLGANGGTLSMDVETDCMLPTRSLWAVASGAASNVYIVRTRLFRKG